MALAQAAIDAPGWSLWEIGVSVLGGGNLIAIIGFIFWGGRKLGSNEAEMVALRKDLDDHGRTDKEAFDHVEEKIENLRGNVGDVKSLIAERPTRTELSQGFQDIQRALQLMTTRIDSAFRRGE